MDRKEAIRLVYGDKAVEDFNEYEYRLPSEAIREKPKGCEVWRAYSQSWADAGITGMAEWYLYRWPKQQKRWWFDPITLAIWSSESTTYTPPDGVMEVTESYAKYLSNKPDGECELRMVKEGDTFYEFSFPSRLDTAGSDMSNYGMTDLGYRWVKTSSLKIVDVVDGMCNGRYPILGNHAGNGLFQAGYIYDNGQQSPHSFMWQDPKYPKHHYAGARSSKYSKPVTPVKVVCARRGK